MNSLIAYALCLVGVQGQSARVSVDFLALSNPPQFTTSRGRVLDPIDVKLHVLTRSFSKGHDTFLIDRKQRVKSTDKSIVRADGLHPLIDTPMLRAIQKRYLGKSVWPYGPWICFRERSDWSQSAYTEIHSPESVLITAIRQLAPGDVAFSQNNAAVKGMSLNGSYKADEIGKDGLFFISYRLRKERVSGWSGTDPILAKERLSTPYNILLGGWKLDYLFSLSAPTKSDRAAIMSYLKFGDRRLVGMSHRQVAWVLGLPVRRKKLKELFKESEWTVGKYRLQFENDRVARFSRSTIQ